MAQLQSCVPSVSQPVSPNILDERRTLSTALLWSHTSHPLVLCQLITSPITITYTYRQDHFIQHYHQYFITIWSRDNAVCHNNLHRNFAASARLFSRCCCQNMLFHSTKPPSATKCDDLKSLKEWWMALGQVRKYETVILHVRDISSASWSESIERELAKSLPCSYWESGIQGQTQAQSLKHG